MKKILLVLFTFLLCDFGQAKTWLVDPQGTYPTPYSVRNLISSGDTIHIKAALYQNQKQAYFTKDNLVFLGVDGRPRIEGGSTLAANKNGKALFAISGANCLIENIEFALAQVPDHNGAGIRQEGCDLTVRNCYFDGNQMGILGGNFTDCKVTIEHCVFKNNGSPKNPGFQHNIYINHIDTLLFQFNFTFDATAQGHELKSRARHNIILYNYIANFESIDSRNIDLPNGGTAIVMGNVIEQGKNSINTNIIAFGAEGLSNPGPHNVWVVNNTFVNRKSKGSFVQVKNGTDKLFLKNNILVGKKTGGLLVGTPTTLDSATNWVSNSFISPLFDSTGGAKYSIKSISPCADQGASISIRVNGRLLVPAYEYLDTVQYKARFNDGKLDIGAYEYRAKIGTGSIEIDDLRLYPNPVEDNVLYSTAKAPRAFTIHSMDGKYVYGGVFVNGKAWIDVPTGIYLLRSEGMSKRLLVK
jgi:hypothetical protein